MSSTKVLLREQELTATAENQRVRLLGFIQKMIQNQSEAEEVLQDVFVDFIEAYDFDTAIESIGAWLLRVARNKVIDRFRRRKTQDDYQLLVQNAAPAETSATENTEDAATRAWLREQVAQALAALPPEQRDVFVQHELEGKTFDEIATATGVSINTLLSRKRYAVLALREHLKEAYDEL